MCKGVISPTLFYEAFLSSSELLWFSVLKALLLWFTVTVPYQSGLNQLFSEKKFRLYTVC